MGLVPQNWKFILVNLIRLAARSEGQNVCRDSLDASSLRHKAVNLTLDDDLTKTAYSNSLERASDANLFKVFAVSDLEAAIRPNDRSCRLLYRVSNWALVYPLCVPYLEMHTFPRILV